MRHAAFGGLVLFAVACGTPSLPPSVPLTQLDAVRQAPLVIEAQSSPAYKEGERLRELALEAERKGDPASAEAYASTARAWFERAALYTRMQRAQVEQGNAEGALEDAEGKATEAKADVGRLEAELAELQKRMLVAKELRKPVLDKASPDRAKARAEAAVALAEEAAILCQAAELVGAKGDVLLAAVKELDHARAAQGSLNDAVAAREACLRALGEARKSESAKQPEASAETLFDDLSRGGWLPVRDERGVIVTLEVAPPDDKLRSLARVAVAHPGIALQIVGHDELGKSKARIDSAKALLAKEGVAESAVRLHDAGTHLPLLQPGDAQAKAKNRRIEVVFVSKTN